MSNKESERDNVLISTNWFGHPADVPMRLVVSKHGLNNDGNQRFALNWFTNEIGKFWGTYDVNGDDLAEAIVNKLSLQDNGIDKFNKLYFKNFSFSQSLMHKIKKINPKIECFYAIF